MSLSVQPLSLPPAPQCRRVLSLLPAAFGFCDLHGCSGAPGEQRRRGGALLKTALTGAASAAAGRRARRSKWQHCKGWTARCLSQSDGASYEVSSMWTYAPPEFRPFLLRSSPFLDAMGTGEQLLPGEVFAVSQQRPADDGSGVDFLELVGGRGWVFVNAPQTGELCKPHIGPTTWKFSPPEDRPLDLRASPSLTSERTGLSLPPGVTFQVSEEVVSDGTTFLRLESGEGWAFDEVAGVGVLCTRCQVGLWTPDEAAQRPEEEEEEKFVLPAELLEPPFPAGSPELERTPVSELCLGQELRGYVTGIDYEGVFVDIGAEVDGWVHISVLSDGEIHDPNNFVSVGQEVDVCVSQIGDMDGRNRDSKFYLSMARKKLRLRPWRPPPRQLKELQPDSWHEGIVTHITEHGAFVVLGDAKQGVGHEGLVHVSKFPGFVRSASDVVRVGQQVRVRVLNTDNSKLALSMVDNEAAQLLPRDQWLNATVYGIKPFGVMVKVTSPTGPAVQGLVHITRMSKEWVDNPSEQVKVGDSVKVRFLDVDMKSRKVSFTMV